MTIAQLSVTELAKKAVIFCRDWTHLEMLHDTETAAIATCEPAFSALRGRPSTARKQARSAASPDEQAVRRESPSRRPVTPPRT
jgi:hypothetical protein